MRQLPTLCERCRHVRIISNNRGSRFYLCELSRESERYDRYPIQPVFRCSGFEADDNKKPSQSGG